MKVPGGKRDRFRESRYCLKRSSSWPGAMNLANSYTAALNSTKLEPGSAMMSRESCGVSHKQVQSPGTCLQETYCIVLWGCCCFLDTDLKYVLLEQWREYGWTRVWICSLNVKWWCYKSRRETHDNWESVEYSAICVGCRSEFSSSARSVTLS